MSGSAPPPRPVPRPGPWARLVGDRPIVTRLVLAVTGAMAVVLLLTGGFVLWRVQFALDRQLDQDLAAYRRVVERAVASGTSVTARTPGQSYQVYDRDGAVVGGTASGRLVDGATLREAVAAEEARRDVGALFPPADRPYRAVAAPVGTGSGPVVLAVAISRSKHDEALRELVLQLVVADLATLAAAAAVGYGTARAALGPVERYRVAAEAARAQDVRLPVPDGRDDELSRLGHTLNGLLDRISRAGARERQFLGDASHELRSPLALMRTEIEWALVRPGDDPAETATTLASLQAQVARLIALSDALLDLEEVRATTGPPRGPVDVGALAAVVADAYADRARAASRSIVVRAPAAAVVAGDARWLETALGNLVANALRHGEGTVEVVVATGATSTRITVSDRGPGFAEGFAPQAFDRFSRAEASRSTDGTGLGLSLVQAVAAAHGGAASIEGASVTLDLPRAGPTTG